jgi:flavin-binding protein dodecin
MAKKQADAVYRIVDVVGVSETSWKRQPARCVICASRK